MDFQVDTTGLNELVADLARAPGISLIKARQAMEVTARKVKDTQRELAPAGPHLPGYASTISYDIKNSFSGGEAEIGPRDVGQGELAGLLEFGGAKSGPHPHILAALDPHLADFERGIAIAAEQSLR
jgi:hypothetical protein